MAEIPSPEPSITALLVDWRNGSGPALAALLERVYPELRRIADRHLARERPDHTLEPTALVNEAYLRLVDQRIDWQHRQHFYAMASRVMRRVLVDHARARQRDKRRGVHVSLASDDATIGPTDIDVLALDQALTRLEAEGFAIETQVVHLRFFGGLTVEETAAQLGVGHATVSRAWTLARTWLHRQLSQ